jgi:hypothetical protein
LIHFICLIKSYSHGDRSHSPVSKTPERHGPSQGIQSTWQQGRKKGIKITIAPKKKAAASPAEKGPLWTHIYASSSFASFLGISANMSVPLPLFDSKFFALVFLNSVCGFDLCVH